MSPGPRQDPLPVTFLVYDAFGGGGVAHTTANLANRLAADHPVRVISLFRWREHPRYPLDPPVEVTVLRVLRRHRRSRTGLDRLPSRLGPVRAGRNMSLLTDLLLRRAIGAVGSGVMISTRPSLHLALTAYARPGVTTIGWEHLNYPARTSRPGHAPVLQAAVPRLDAYVVLTEADAADYRRLLPDAPTHIEVIRNSVTWPPAPGPPGPEI